MEERDKLYVYENCGDHCVQAKPEFRRTSKKGGHFVDPLLKLYKGIPLMLVSNDDVPNGHANGTRVRLEAVITKASASGGIMSIDGMDCRCFEAEEVKHLVCRAEDNQEKLFYIEAKAMTCTVKAPLPKSIGAGTKATVNFTVSLTQFPLIANNATTGHKLQGQTKESLVISVWTSRRNWNYVALSRVKTRAGLYLIQKLPYGTDFSMSPELRMMTETLRQHTPENVEWDLDTERAEAEAQSRGVTMNRRE